ncbi:alginate lyase family protein [Planctomycetota bacterium]|nr:alginate lyase family protein [Planctomycetota bacterium]
MNKIKSIANLTPVVNCLFRGARMVNLVSNGMSHFQSLIVCSFLPIYLVCVACNYANADLKMILSDASDLIEARKLYLVGDPKINEQVSKLVQNADALLNGPMYTIVNKPYTPPSGSNNDYMSLSPYYWPNPNAEDGLPYIRRDGEINPERERYDKAPFGKMVNKVNTLALAYFFTEHERYAKQAAKQLRIWFLDYETRMNPNMKFAQFVPGKSEGRNYGIIETVRFRWLIDSINMLEDSKAWTTENQKDVVAWFRAYRDWLLSSKLGKLEAACANNHGTWYVQQVCLYSLFIGDKITAKKMCDIIIDRIDKQIESDGFQPLEASRTRGIDYCNFNNRAFWDMAYMAKEHLDINLYDYESTNGSSIKKATDYMLPYYVDEKEWPYRQITTPKYRHYREELRRVSKLLDDVSYEEYLIKVPGGDSIGLELDLRMPPVGTK